MAAPDWWPYADRAMREADRINGALGDRLAEIVRRAERLTPGALSSVQRAADQLLDAAYGLTPATSQRSAIFRVIQAETLNTASDTVRKFMDPYRAAMGETLYQRFVDASSRNPRDPLGLAVKLQDPVMVQRVQIAKAMGLDPQRRWVRPRGYRLSDRVWRVGRLDRAAINDILRRGMVRGDSPVTIANELVRFLNADQLPYVDWNGGLPVWRNTTTTPYGGRGSYQARRLARTEMAAMHHDATVQMVQSLPLPEEKKLVRWVLSNAHPQQDICDTYADHDEGEGRGVWPAGDVPSIPHPHCVPGWVRVDGPPATGAVQRWWCGDLVEIATEGGHHLSITPNHPVLTDHGWVRAGEIAEGDNLICDGGGEWAISGRIPDDERRPPAIQDVVETINRASGMTPVRVSPAAEQFHGDGSDSEISVVWSDRLLHDRVQAAISQKFGNVLFTRRNAALSLLSGDRVPAFALERLGSTADRSASEFLGNPLLSPARDVQIDDFSSVTTSRVRTITTRAFCGHVFNLQTKENWYIANGITVHNCICNLQPVIPPPNEVVDLIAKKYGL